MGGKANNIKKLMVFLSFLHFCEARKRCLSILGAVLDDVGLRVVFFRFLFGHVGDKRANNRGKMAT